MLRALFIGVALTCVPFSSAIPMAYAEEIVVEKENMLQEGDLQEFPDEDIAPHGQVIDVRKLFFKTLFLLVGLCALVIAGGYFLKRITGGKLSSFNTNGSIQLVERKYLSPKSSVWLIEVNDQPLVVIDSQYGVAIHCLKEKAQELNPTAKTFTI